MCSFASIHSGRTTSRWRSSGAARSDIERNDLGLEPPCIDAEPCHGNRQAESPRAGAPGIEIEHAVAALDARLVRVARDDRVVAGGARVDVQLVEVVQHVERMAALLDDFRLS